MKSTTLIVAASLAAIGFAGSASAYKFSPAPTHIKAVGPGSATLGTHTVSGTATFKIAVGRTGRGKVTGVTLCGKSGCGLIGTAGLPWKMQATSASTATMANVTLTSAAGNCGPANLHVTVSGGVISYNGPLGQCSQVTFTLTTTPTMSIVP